MERGGTPAVRTGRQLRFDPYRLDLDAGVLRSGDRTISVRPKTWAVLRYLAEHPGVLITKDELLDAVWGDVSVSEATLTKSICEIRDVLNDEVRRPRFVETVHRRGFRFVSAVAGGSGPSIPGLLERSAGRDTVVPSRHDLDAPRVVGREVELARLHDLFEAAAAGARQTAFVTGEAGVGKTALVSAWLASVARTSDAMIAVGQCVRRHGGDEPLMPALEALARLARGSHAERVARLLRDRAPSWLVQLPWLVDAEELRELRATLAGMTPERMLRVFAQLVEELTSDVTLVLLLEDLHWADPATVDLVSVLAQRPERARLLVIGTYRPAEAIARAGPFDVTRRALMHGRRSVEIPIGRLPLAGVERWLGLRFGGRPTPPWLARLLHAHTDGNPLFLVTAVDYLIGRRWIEPGGDGIVVTADESVLERHVPGSLHDLVEAQIVGLEPEQVAVLEAGSAAGFEFGAQAAAAAIDVPVERVEEVCEGLVRSLRFLRERGTEAWPDGAVAARYGFTHAVYQRVFYRRIPAGRRRLLHQKIGERLEAGFGARAAEAAVELAEHFEQGTLPTRAIPWLEVAAASAGARFAPREAAGFLRRALRLLETEPETPQRWKRELQITAALGPVATALEGFGSEEARACLTRARELATRVGSPLELFHVLYLLVSSSHSRAELDGTFELTEAIGRAATLVGTDDARLLGAMHAANNALWEGRLADAATLGTVAAADAKLLGASVPGVNPVVWSGGVEGWRLWLLGFPDRALAVEESTIRHACSVGPLELAMGAYLASHVHVWRGDLDEAERLVEDGCAVATEYGLALWHAGLRGIRGIVALARGGGRDALADVHQAAADFRRFDCLVVVPAWLAAIAEGSLRLGEIDAGLTAVDEGLELVRTTLSRWYAPDLWRLRAELLAARGEPSDVVEPCLHRALELSDASQARAFALRAATTLARRLAKRRLKADARATLRPRFECFTEGLTTPDLRAALILLSKLGA